MDDTDGPQQPEDVLNLRELIQTHMGRTGDSMRALGERSGIAHQTLGTWSAGTIKTFPDPETIQAFANATSFNVQTVVLAAARTLGLSVRDSDSLLAQSLPPGADKLTPEDRDAIVAVTRQLVAARTDTEPEPPQPDLDKVEGWRIAETGPLRVVPERGNSK